MDKLLIILFDLTALLIAVSKIATRTGDYKHSLYAVLGAMLISVRMGPQGVMNKVSYTLGGFVFASAICPAIVDYFGIDHHGNYSNAIHFFGGLIGMYMIPILIDLLAEVKAQTPSVVKTFFSKIKSIIYPKNDKQS